MTRGQNWIFVGYFLFKHLINAICLLYNVWSRKTRSLLFLSSTLLA